MNSKQIFLLPKLNTYHTEIIKDLQQAVFKKIKAKVCLSDLKAYSFSFYFLKFYVYQKKKKKSGRANKRMKNL